MGLTCTRCSTTAAFQNSPGGHTVVHCVMDQGDLAALFRPSSEAKSDKPIPRHRPPSSPALHALHPAFQLMGSSFCLGGKQAVLQNRSAEAAVWVTLKCLVFSLSCTLKSLANMSFLPDRIMDMSVPDSQQTLGNRVPTWAI